MDVSGMNTQLLTQTLVESFNALADEVQNLSDRQTILEHKLRYAHEQVCRMFLLLPIPGNMMLSLLACMLLRHPLPRPYDETIFSSRSRVAFEAALNDTFTIKFLN